MENRQHCLASGTSHVGLGCKRRVYTYIIAYRSRMHAQSSLPAVKSPTPQPLLLLESSPKMCLEPLHGRDAHATGTTVPMPATLGAKSRCESMNDASRNSRCRWPSPSASQTVKAVDLLCERQRVGCMDLTTYHQQTLSRWLNAWATCADPLISRTSATGEHSPAMSNVRGDAVHIGSDGRLRLCHT